MSIKYRTSAGTSASNFSDLVVKVGDTLPIGSEIDYDGQTVPAGWQEVEETNLGDVVVDSIKTKNMFNYNASVLGAIAVNSTSEATDGNNHALTSSWMPCKPNTKYTISGSANRLRFQTKASNGTITFVPGASTITTNSTAKYIRVYYYYKDSGPVSPQEVKDVQLEEGTTATSYTPFQKLDNQEIYSTGEIQIGTWIDGKPLYRKVIETTAPSLNDTNANIYTFVENIENVVNMYGYAYYQPASYKGSINCYISSADYIATWVLVNSNGIPTNIRCRQNNRISASMKIIIEYTKTTD